MQRTLIRLGVLGVALVFACALGYSAIGGSKHDLSTTGGITDRSTGAFAEDETCVFCHTPHGASTAGPLWNHTTSTAGPYSIYTSSTMEADPTAFSGSTSVVSALCMSCHDGTVAVNSQYNPTDPNGNNPTMGSGNELDPNGKILSTRPTYLGTDLSNDHPVNMNYNTAQSTDGELNAADDPNDWVVTNEVPLFAGTVQCASCHDPHSANAKFLVVSNAQSALCTKCHTK